MSVSIFYLDSSFRLFFIHLNRYYAIKQPPLCYHSFQYPIPSPSLQITIIQHIYIQGISGYFRAFICTRNDCTSRLMQIVEHMCTRGTQLEVCIYCLLLVAVTIKTIIKKGSFPKLVMHDNCNDF